MKSRRAERTYFNTEYMPELEEDAIESNDPMEIERGVRDIDGVVKADKERFRRLCKKVGFDFPKINKEYERKKKAIERLKAHLKELETKLRCVGWHDKERKARLRKEIKSVKSEIENYE